MKTKAFKLTSLIVALVAAVILTVGYVFAWFFDTRDADFTINGKSAGAYFDSGDGSEEKPFVIANPTHMHNLAVLQNTGKFAVNGVQKQYYFEIKKTIDEIDMTYMYMPPIGNDEYPFIGIFNGNGKTVSNLTVTTNKSLLGDDYPVESGDDYQFSRAVGLFGMTGDKSDISNVILQNPLVDVANTNTRYFSADAGSVKAAQQVAGIAVGFVAGKCSSIGVRAINTGATLHLKVNGYSTFNSILGALGDNVTSAVTGGGAGSMGTGGSGNAFGATFDVDTMYDRLKQIVANKNSATPAWRLPNLGNSSSESITLNNLEKLPFTVDGALSTYNGADAKEIIAKNNIGYLLGNQNKVYAKTVKFGDPIKTTTNGSYLYSDGTDPSTKKIIPRWFYKTNTQYIGENTYNTSNMIALTESEFAALPQGIKDLLPASNGQVEEYGSIRISQTYSNGTRFYAGSEAGPEWSPHGQISWMGNTYGLGYTMTDYKGDAVDENGNRYAANGNLIGADGYDVDENGAYVANPANYPDFPYVIDSVGTTWPYIDTAYDSYGNVYYRYDHGNNGEHVYGVLLNGYLKTGDVYQYYVAPFTGGAEPVALIDANGYAMYADGVYYDVSGNIVQGAYVRDENGLYIASDPAFSMPISQIVGGYAQDADGNYYGVTTLNGNSVYCYLGADGTTSGYSGWYMIDLNNFLVPAASVDANGNVMYNATDYYGSYNGQKGYVDANGYFYDENHAYVVTDDGFGYTAYLADANGYAMADENRYYGKLSADYTTEYAYLVKRGDKFYWNGLDGNFRVDDKDFYGTIKFIGDNGEAMASEDTYYGRSQVNGSYVYGVLDVRNGKTYLNIDGKYVANDGNTYEFMDDNGHFKYAADSELYYGRLNSWTPGILKLSADGYVYDDSYDDKGNIKGYYIPEKNNGNYVIDGYHVCVDVDDDNYGYFVNDAGVPYYSYYSSDHRLKAWGYTAEEIKNLQVGPNQYYSWNPAAKGELFYAVEGGEKFTVQEGAPISVESGEIDKAISGEDINGLEGQFITPKEIEKIKVVTATVDYNGNAALGTGDANDALDKVLVAKALPVQLYRFTQGVVLPNNAIWFKPSIAGKIRLVMYAESPGDGFSLIQGHRTSATKEDPFKVDYNKPESDIVTKEIAKCGLPSRVLFYFEYDISQEEIDDGRYEYWILQNDGNGGTTDPGGAFFVYLDLGASAPEEVEDTSGIDHEKAVSAIDFIYDGVEIKQGNPADDAADATIRVGDFIVKTSGDEEALYEPSKTSVYFENLSTVFKLVFLRLHAEDGKHSGKTICLEQSNPVPDTNSDIKATFATYVCPTIGGGSGTSSGGGGGGTVTPTPGPDDPTPTGGSIDLSEEFKNANGRILNLSNTNGDFTIISSQKFKGKGSFKVDGETVTGALIDNTSNVSNIQVTATNAVKVTIRFGMSDGNASKTAASTVTVTSSVAGNTYNSLTFEADSNMLNSQTIELDLAAGETVTITPSAGKLNIISISYDY